MAYRRWVAAFDLHGDQQDPAAVNAFYRFCRDFKPHDRIVGGDVFDMRALRNKATEEERRECIQPDFDAGMAFLEAFRPTAILLGNHDSRIWKNAEKQRGPVTTLCRGYVEQINDLATKMRAPVLPYHKSKGVYPLGPVNVLHGFYTGDGACKQHAAIYGPAIFGHIHTAGHIVLATHGERRREAWSSPCLARHDMEYNEATPSTLRYDVGWPYGVVSDSECHVYMAQVRGGKVSYADDVKVVAA